MKKMLFFVAVVATVVSFVSCATKQNADYYRNPYNYSGKPLITDSYTPSDNNKTVTSKTREIMEVERLAAEATERMRVVGTSHDFEENYARIDAERNAQEILAANVSTAVLNLTKEYRKKTNVNGKMYNESQLEGFIETAVAEKISTRKIGAPEIKDLSDGSVKVYVCVELTKTTKELLSEVYDTLKNEEIIGVDYDKAKFIQENKDQLDQMRNSIQ